MSTSRRGRILARVIAVAVLALLVPAARAAAAPPDSLPPAHVRAWQVGLLRPDRLEHGSLSFTLAAGMGLAGRPRTEAALVTLGLGTLKELHDRRTSRFDPIDLAADAAGAALGAWAATH